MDKNNEQHSEMPFILGMVSLLLALILLGLALYVFPAFVLGFDYNMPDAISTLMYFFEDKYQMSIKSAGTLVFLLFLIPGLIAVYFAIREGKILDIENNEDLREQELQNHPVSKVQGEPSFFDSLGIVGKAVLIALVVFVVIRLLQWLIATPNP